MPTSNISAIVCNQCGTVNISKYYGVAMGLSSVSQKLMVPSIRPQLSPQLLLGIIIEKIPPQKKIYAHQSL